MANGDIVTARFPISTDVNDIADVSVTIQLAALFPTADYDILTTELVQIGGDGGIFKNVIIVVGRKITA